MRLTWRDGVASVLLALAVALAMAATRGWGWPMTGSYRIASLAVFGLGIVMCALSDSAQALSANGKGAYVVLASTLGVAALVIVAFVLFTGSEGWLVALVVDIAVLWALSTSRHAVSWTTRRPIEGPAGAH